jgi:hypothetical protein
MKATTAIIITGAVLLLLVAAFLVWGCHAIGPSGGHWTYEPPVKCPAGQDAAINVETNEQFCVQHKG